MHDERTTSVAEAGLLFKGAQRTTVRNDLQRTTVWGIARGGRSAQICGVGEWKAKPSFRLSAMRLAFSTKLAARSGANSSFAVASNRLSHSAKCFGSMVPSCFWLIRTWAGIGRPL